MIDGSVVHKLQADPFSVIAPAGSVNNTLATFGSTYSAVPVNASMGIRLDFTLTPGDSAAFLSRFEREVDPDGTLTPEERRRRAVAARKAHMARLAHLSATKRAKGTKKATAATVAEEVRNAGATSN